MKRNKIFILLFFISFTLIGFPLRAEIPPKIFGENECSIDSTGDNIGENGTLRNRIELYNFWGHCKFHLSFSFSDRTIVLNSPLVLEKRVNDRENGTFTGTWIDGLGTRDEELKIKIDALQTTKEKGRCAFEVKGGFSAWQQIHGLTIFAQTVSQAICDENGKDLLERVVSGFEDPICAGQKGKDCQFAGVTVLVPEVPAPMPSPQELPPTPKPEPKSEPTSVPTDHSNSRAGDESNLSSCRLAPGNHFFSFSRIFPLLFGFSLLVFWRRNFLRELRLKKIMD